MGFECFRCGECCRHLGLVHTISEDCGEYRYVIDNKYTGEKTPVTVDPDKRELFLDRSIFAAFPHACPFFRHEAGTGLASCTVHGSRPGICRDYGCWRILILNHRGYPVGKIRFVRSLITEDPQLRRVWDACVAEIVEPDDARWENQMIKTLVRAGYSVRT